MSSEENKTFIDWPKVWDTLEEWIANDSLEGAFPNVERTRQYTQLIVEKQLRRSNETK